MTLLKYLHIYQEPLRELNLVDINNSPRRIDKMVYDTFIGFNPDHYRHNRKIIHINNKAIIIDYKTNNESIDLDLLKFGLSLQLPIYLYLLNNENPDIEVLGLYIQHILDLDIKYDPKGDYIENKKKKMKLDGITFTSDDISLFDDTYEKSVNILSLSKKKDGEFSKSKHIIDINKRDDIKKTALDLIYKAVDSVSDGKFDIYPLMIEAKENACSFCPYKDICYRKYKDFNNQVIEKGSDENE